MVLKIDKQMLLSEDLKKRKSEFLDKEGKHLEYLVLLLQQCNCTKIEFT